MNNVLKEKLIEIVRQHECLYDIKNKDYKNKASKMFLWEKIGATLEIEGSEAKELWRSLRDGYVRHKKAMKEQTGPGRKYSYYSWSPHMSFLDETLELKAKATASQQDTDATEVVPTSSSSRELTAGNVIKGESSSLLRRKQSSQEVENNSPKPLKRKRVFASRKSQHPSTNQTQSVPRSITKRKHQIDSTEKILNYFRHENKEYDEVDHLFTSYAKSFKKLSMRQQSKMKVALAKLFADAELEDYENNSANESVNQSSSVMYWSPSYSTMSNESTDAIVLKEEAEDPITENPIEY